MEYFEYPEGKTNYQIKNEEGELTTITLEKWVADILQLELKDVHDAIQKAYYKIVDSHPKLGRREKGNLIRQAAMKKANEFQVSKKKILGWNDDDVLDAFGI